MSGRPWGRPRRLNDAQVAEIRAWYNEMKARRKLPTCTDLSRRMKISRSAIYSIGKGYQYKTVKT